jgi:hypothetical protein
VKELFIGLNAHKKTRTVTGGDHRKLIIKLAAKTLSWIYYVIKTGEPYELLKP